MSVQFNITETIELTEGTHPDIDALVKAFKDGTMNTITVKDEGGNITHTWVKS